MTDAQSSWSLRIGHWAFLGHWSLGLGHYLCEPLVLERSRRLRLVVRLAQLQELRRDLEVLAYRDLQVERRARHYPYRVARGFHELGVVGDVLSAARALRVCLE